LLSHNRRLAVKLLSNGESRYVFAAGLAIMTIAFQKMMLEEYLYKEKLFMSDRTREQLGISSSQH
jgi:hypothetical protein